MPPTDAIFPSGQPQNANLPIASGVPVFSGEPWEEIVYDGRIAGTVLPLDEVMLDFYHFSEHVGEAGKATLGEEGTKEWIHTVLHLARNVGYEPMFQQLLDWRGKLRGGKRCVADRLIHYVAQRREMIRALRPARLGRGKRPDGIDVRGDDRSYQGPWATLESGECRSGHGTRSPAPERPVATVLG